MKLLGFERRWLLAIFDTLLPSRASERLLLGARDFPLGAFVDDLLRRAPMHFALGLRAMLWVVTLSPPFVLRRFSTFAGLSRASRLRLLETLGQSRHYVIRELPLFFKTAACLGYCGLPEVQRAVGIFPVDATPPDWLPRETEPAPVPSRIHLGVKP